MAVFNPPQALPGVAFALARFVQREGGSAPRARVDAALDPFRGNDVSGNVKDTVIVLKALELLDETDEVLCITDRFAQRLDEPLTRAAFEVALRREVHAVDRDGDPWDDSSAVGGRDAGRALSWFLCQPALAAPMAFDGPPERSADLRQRADLGGAADALLAFENDVRFGSFRRWAVGLGLATPVRARSHSGQIATYVEPVPTAAIEAELSLLSPNHMPVGGLLDELRRAMPYLPGGATAERLIARVGAPLDPAVQRGRLHTSLGEALLTLEARGLVTFEALADADGVILEHGPDGRKVTHVTFSAEVTK